MLVPTLDMHSHKRRTSIFQKKRYSPVRGLEKSRQLDKTIELVKQARKQNEIRQRFNYSLEEELPIRQIQRYIPKIQPYQRLSPHTYERRIPIYRPQVMLLQERLLPPILPSLDLPPPLIYPLEPLLHPLPPPLPPPIYHPIDPILLRTDTSSLLASPIIHEAPSTYFELSQRILGSTLPRHQVPPFPMIQIDRQLSTKKYRQSPTKDYQLPQRPGNLNKNVYIDKKINTIGQSHVSFGGNNIRIPPQNEKIVNPEPRKPRHNPYLQIIDDSPNNTNFPIITVTPPPIIIPIVNPPTPYVPPIPKPNDQNVNIQNQMIPKDLLGMFQELLTKQEINEPLIFPPQWIALLKQCVYLSQQQRMKLIKQRLQLWKRHIQTIIQQQTWFKDTNIKDELKQMNKKDLKYQQKMQRFNNELSEYENKINNIIQPQQSYASLSDLERIKYEYITSQNKCIFQINKLIKKTEEQLKRKDNNIVQLPTPSFFQ